MSGSGWLAALEQRFSGRPHVGVVTHFEGVDVAGAAERLRAALAAAGLEAEDAVERVRGEPVYSAAAAVAEGEGLELWLVASGKAGVGCKVEARVFHALEDSALADEYLAGFAARLAGGI